MRGSSRSLRDEESRKRRLFQDSQIGRLASMTKSEGAGQKRTSSRIGAPPDTPTCASFRLTSFRDCALAVFAPTLAGFSVALGGWARGWWSVSGVGFQLPRPRFLLCARGAVQAGGQPGEELTRCVCVCAPPGSREARGGKGTPSYHSALSRQAGASRPWLGLRPSPCPGSQPDRFPLPVSQLLPSPR